MEHAKLKTILEAAARLQHRFKKFNNRISTSFGEDAELHASLAEANLILDSLLADLDSVSGDIDEYFLDLPSPDEDADQDGEIQPF